MVRCMGIVLYASADTVWRLKTAVLETQDLLGLQVDLTCLHSRLTRPTRQEGGIATQIQVEDSLTRNLPAKPILRRSYMSKRAFLYAAVALALALSGVSLSPTKVANAGYWTTAYAVNFTHWDPWYEPHFGARFSGCQGSQQYFTGSSGQPGGYSSYNWWGTCYYVLLLNKSWLYEPVCGTPPNQLSSCPDRWYGPNHHAYMAYH